MLLGGLPAEFHELEEGSPVVYGEILPKSFKTLLCYSHYDIQPPGTMEAWTHGGPWSDAVVDGVLYGRGPTDTKIIGHLLVRQPARQCNTNSILAELVRRCSSHNLSSLLQLLLSNEWKKLRWAHFVPSIKARKTS